MNEILWGEKNSIFSFSILYWRRWEMPYIQFCRASQALSNGIWLGFQLERIFGKKSQKLKVEFFTHFLGVLQVKPVYPTLGKSLDRNILDSYIGQKSLTS